MSARSVDTIEFNGEGQGQVTTSGGHETGEEKSKDQTYDSETSKPLDGGLRAWLQVAGAFLVFFNIWGFPISFGAYQIFYELHYIPNSSASNISWIGTTQGFLLILVGIFGGPLYDLGYYRELVWIGSFMAVLGVMMLSICTQYWQIFLAQGLCVGVGCGLLYVPSLALIGSAFKAQRAVAMGVVTAGVAMGGIIYTIIFQQLLPTVGFAWTTRIMGFVALFTFLVAIPLLLYKPAGSSNPSSDTKRQARSLIDVQAFKSAPFVVFTLAGFFIFAGYLIPLFYIPVFANVNLQASTKFSLWILVISQASSLVGRIVTSLLAQKFGSMLVWIICCAGSGILCLAWIAIHSTGSFIAFAALYGFLSSALVALPPAVFPLVSPDPATLGTRMGMSWGATAVAFLIGSPIAGALTNSSGGSSSRSSNAMDFTGAQIFSGVLLLSGAGLLVVLWVLLGLQTPSTESTKPLREYETKK